MRRKRNNKENQGITLIALIITVILLLILVGVSVNLIIKGNLFSNAQKAVDGTNAKVNEQQNAMDDIMNEWKKIENDLHKNEFWINIKYYDGSPAIVCEMSEKIYNSEGNTITFSQKEKIIEEACIDEISTSLQKKYRKFFRGNVFVTKSRGGRGE